MTAQMVIQIMDGKEPAYFDLETVALLRETLDEAWVCLRPEQRATMLKTTLAERILKSAAQGERDRERLHDAAPTEFRQVSLSSTDEGPDAATALSQPASALK